MHRPLMGVTGRMRYLRGTAGQDHSVGDFPSDGFHRLLLGFVFCGLVPSVVGHGSRLQFEAEKTTREKCR